MAACKKASLWIFAILFLVLAIVSLVAVVGLGNLMYSLLILKRL